MTEKNSLINPKASFLSNGFLVIVFALFFLGTFGCLEYYLDDQNFFGPLKLAWLIQKNFAISITWRMGVIIFFGLLLISRRPVFSAVTTLYIFGLIVAGSLNKIHYLDAPLTVADLHFFLATQKKT